LVHLEVPVVIINFSFLARKAYYNCHPHGGNKKIPKDEGEIIGGSMLSLMKAKLSDYERLIKACAIECKCGHCLYGCVTFEATDNEEVFPRKRMTMALDILQGKQNYTKETVDLLQYCTSCRYCVDNCFYMFDKPIGITIDVPKITEVLRRDAIRATGLPSNYELIKQNIQKTNNVLGEPPEKRFDWLASTGLKLPEKARVVYFAGCIASYREQEEASSTVELLKMAGIDVTVMGEEVCCGSPLLRSGQPELAVEVARKNFEKIKAMKPDLMVTSCAGCCKTWTLDYPEMFGEKLPFRVMHSSEHLNTLVRAGRIKLKTFDKTVTYHDPCHLGRGLGMFAPSRDALKRIKGIDYVEMESHGKMSKCCGAGGGFRSLDRKLSIDIARNRVNEAKDVGAEVMVTACSFCSYNFKDAGGIEVIGLPVILKRLAVSKSRTNESSKP